MVFRHSACCRSRPLALLIEEGAHGGDLATLTVATAVKQLVLPN
jgi:hypothetical protein